MVWRGSADGAAASEKVRRWPLNLGGRAMVVGVDGGGDMRIRYVGYLISGLGLVCYSESSNCVIFTLTRGSTRW